MNYITQSRIFKDKLLERFTRYVKIWSESDSGAADRGVFPSTERQRDFAESLRKELEGLGLSSVQVTKDCYVYGILPATEGHEADEPVLFLSHLDTVDEVTGKDVRPQVFADYDGRLIKLSHGVTHDIKKDALLAKAASKRETIITSDGSTLLGADDKAGIAAIMTALEYLCGHTELGHRRVEVIFSPDEETGHGMDRVPLELIQSQHAYTVDGGEEGEMETECFNAFSARVEFTGRACHTGSARENRMVNAVIMASKFTGALPHSSLPETTDGYQGFIAPMDIQGTIEKACISLLLRAFTMQELEEQKQLVQELARSTALSAGGTETVTFRQQYLNMREQMDKNPEIVRSLENAYREAGVTPVKKPIRGGTDGSRLTEMGIPTPNIFTGAHNFHSRNEWCSLEQMARASDVIINLTIS